MRSVAGKVKGGSHRREAMCSGGLQARYREKPRLLKAGAPLLNQPRLRGRGLERRRSGVLRLLESLARPVRIVVSGLGGDIQPAIESAPASALVWNRQGGLEAPLRQALTSLLAVQRDGGGCELAEGWSPPGIPCVGEGCP